MQRQSQNENTQSAANFMTVAEQVLNKTAFSVGTANVGCIQTIEEEVKSVDQQ